MCIKSNIKQLKPKNNSEKYEKNESNQKISHNSGETLSTLIEGFKLFLVWEKGQLSPRWLISRLEWKHANK